MAAPATTTRTTPTGIALEEGFSFKVAFSRLPSFSIWEVGGKPAGVDNGDPINITTQFNERVLTKSPRRLNEITNISGTCAYDPNALKQARDSLVGQKGSVTFLYPDGTTEDAFGYLKSLIPQDLSIGEFPLADYEIVITNWDPTNRVEQRPVTTQVTGT